MLLKDYLDEEKLEKKPVREGAGVGVMELGAEKDDIVVLTADVSSSARANFFEEKYPDRFIQCGVAEQNMAGIAGGLAYNGMRPFIFAYSVFAVGRNWEPIRTTIAYPNNPVVICASHAGVATGEDGATHQMTEDIAIMRTMPNMTVLSPADYNEARLAVKAAYELKAPVYIRLIRGATPIFTKPDTPFKIGKARVLQEGSDVTLIATGITVYEALQAVEELRIENQELSVELINLHTIKPIDKETIIASAKKTGKVITVEDHQIEGGMGSAVAEVLSENYPLPIKRLGLNNSFGSTGDPKSLLAHFGINRDGIKKAIISFTS
ncbi:MAG: transketolase C-terminal domain-containing protein [Patescibacteria group bacterium]